MSAASQMAQIPTAAVHALIGQGAADFEVFLPSPSDGAPVLYRRAGTGISQPDLDRMAAHGVSHLFLRADDLPACEAALESQLAELLADPTIPPVHKAEIVQSAGTSVARNLIHEDSITTEGVQRATRIVDTMVSTVLDDPTIAAHMLQMAGHERSTASHMFIVSTLAIMLGSEVLGSDEETLRDLGVAGMLHDLGKLSVPGELLNKSTPLNRDELALLQQHPIESVRLIGDDPQVTDRTRQIILQHHERIDGRGYPLGLPAADLLFGSKLLTIVDCFHAMIGRRSYRSSVEPAEANRILMTQSGKQFDGDLLYAWTALCERCCSMPLGERPTGTQLPGEEDVTSRHEHRPAPSTPASIDRRPLRHECGGDSLVTCVYVGRLASGTGAAVEFSALVHDISRSGVCIYAAHPMYRGELVNVRVRMDEDDLWIRSAVAWCRQRDAGVYRIGLRFVGKIPTSQSHEPAAPEPLQEPCKARTGETRSSEDSGTTNAPCDTKEAVAPSQTHALQSLAAIAARPRADRDAQRCAVTLAMSGDVIVRLKALDLLISMNTRMTRDALATLVQDSDGQVQERAISAIGALKIQEGIASLRELLLESDKRLALRAAGALGQLHNRSGLELAASILNRDVPEARLAARVVGDITGHRFAANREGIRAARRYLEAKKLVPA